MIANTVRVHLGERSYSIYIGSGILDEIGERLVSFPLSPKIAVVSNPTVFSFYGERVARSLRGAGFDLLTVTIPDGEEFKTLEWAQHIYDRLLEFGLDRSSAIVALGGGVIGDIAGFVASTYMRGIPCVHVPTTLLAQVDSSVGGKTGVNHRLGKNMIGTFWQPIMVWIDTDTLTTLPERELRAGLAEVIKYSVIRDEDLFAFLEGKRDGILRLESGALAHIIWRSCDIKADVVAKDERESGLRAILNYGHTIGHALETVSGYTRFLHGEAVAIGMHMEARLSEMLGFLAPRDALRIRELIEAFALPSRIPHGISANDILASIKLDKKAVAGEITCVLPVRVGGVRIERSITKNALRDLLAAETQPA